MAYIPIYVRDDMLNALTSISLQLEEMQHWVEEYPSLGDSIHKELIKMENTNELIRAKIRRL